MPSSQSLRERVYSEQRAHAFASLDAATNASLNVTYTPYKLPRNKLNGKSVVIIGAGVAGLCTAYEVLANNDQVHVKVFEAREKIGGRCISLRTGDTVVEDETSDLYSTGKQTVQKVHFDLVDGEEVPYLNAGPGRIPSSHRRLLHYLREFKVPLEVYVMDSMSNMIQMPNGPDGAFPVVNRRIIHNTRGYIAEMVYKNACQLLGNVPCEKGDQDEDVVNLRSLMKTFGDLSPDGTYVTGTADPGEESDEDVSDRAGYVKLPGVTPGLVAKPFSRKEILDSRFWAETRVYQPQDFLWQPTLFQPVGGMDKVVFAFAEEVKKFDDQIIEIGKAVKGVRFDEGKEKYEIAVEGERGVLEADLVFCNAPMVFLEKILDKELLYGRNGLKTGFQDALHAVFQAQRNSNPTERFLAPTTKVGWQADRRLWEGSDSLPVKEVKPTEDPESEPVDKTEVGVVPIYGGISFTEHPITQIWYPSSGYHESTGILTGAYNFSTNAINSGNKSPKERLYEAREGAALFGKKFARGLDNGVSIAWQKVPYIKGGWAQWGNVEESVRHYNEVIQGSGVGGREVSFFVIGDQTSSLPGWQEGAVSSALGALSRVAEPRKLLPYLKRLPDPRIMVEGI